MHNERLPTRIWLAVQSPWARGDLDLHHFQVVLAKLPCEHLIGSECGGSHATMSSAGVDDATRCSAFDSGHFGERRGGHTRSGLRRRHLSNAAAAALSGDSNQGRDLTATI